MANEASNTPILQIANPDANFCDAAIEAWAILLLSLGQPAGKATSRSTDAAPCNRCRTEAPVQIDGLDPTPGSISEVLGLRETD